MLKLAIVRYRAAREATLGILFIGGAFSCYTMERPMLADGTANVPNLTAIPNGTYPVRMMASAHFDRSLPHVLDVPGRSAIEMHAGNRVEDCKGCVMLGYIIDCRGPALLHSLGAVNDVCTRLVNEGELELSVEGVTLG